MAPGESEEGIDESAGGRRVALRHGQQHRDECGFAVLGFGKQFMNGAACKRAAGGEGVKLRKG